MHYLNFLNPKMHWCSKNWFDNQFSNHIVQIFWEGHKNLKTYPALLCLTLLSNFFKKVEDFFSNFVASSQYLNLNMRGPIVVVDCIELTILACWHMWNLRNICAHWAPWNIHQCRLDTVGLENHKGMHTGWGQHIDLHFHSRLHK